MSTRNLLSTLLAAALTMPVFAQESTHPAAPAPAAAAPAAPAVAVQGAEPTASTVSRDKDTLSVDFPDEDIKTILRNVADLFELNLVVPDTLAGKTSIKLRDVTWEQIFKTVLDPVDFTYAKEGNIIKIVSKTALEQEAVETQVFVLNNAKAADIKPTVDGLVDASKGGKILVDARSNGLVITERPSRMGRIQAIIDQLDKATDQVMIESKFVEVTDRDVRNIGVNWQSLQNLQLGAAGIQQTWNKTGGRTTSDGITGNTNTTGTNTKTYTSPVNTTTTTTNSGTTLTNQTVTSIDPVTNLPKTTTTQVTIPTNTSNTVTTTSPATTSETETLTTTSSPLNSLMSLTNTGSVARAATAVFSSSDFNIIVSALKSLNTVQVVSNPTVVTLNNTEATLNIGEEFPVPSYTYNSERGSFEVSGFSYKPIGVILKVTPQVNARGTIKMSIEPEVSQRNGETSFGGAGGASIPIIATRKVKTQISLQSGYTAGIGGLITASKSHGNTKVPLLGDIPGLGKLFSSKSVNDQTSNLLIFITARTVTADGASPEEVFDPRAIQSTDMTRDDLPGHRAPKGTDPFAATHKAEK